MRIRCLTGLLALVLVAVPRAEAQFRFGKFGPIRIYRQGGPVEQVAIFISGDGGWTPGVTEMARELAHDRTLVLGLDIRYLRNALDRSADACVYPAADLEALSHYAQRKLDLPSYHQPVLAGYSGGATLAYAALAQAPPGTFSGALSLAFCLDLLLGRPLCRGEGLSSKQGVKHRLVYVQPVPHLSAPWVVLQGAGDEACAPAATRQFVGRVAGARFIALDSVGHGFARKKHWASALRSTLATFRAGPAARSVSSTPGSAFTGGVAVTDLPLVELPTPGGRTLAVILSGDGGWASIDRHLGEALQDSEVAVVGLNSLQYFWHRRTPDAAAADLARVIRHYLPAWKRDRIALIGYSFGADVLPFLAARLPADVRSRVLLVALLGAGRSADFEFRLSDWLGGGGRGSPVAPEVGRLRGMQVLCFSGRDEEDSVCPDLPPAQAERIPLPGGHHFGGDYAGIARTLLDRMRRSAP